jgi:hypothetical protein
MKRQVDKLESKRLRYLAKQLNFLQPGGAANEQETRLLLFREKLAKAEGDIAAGRFIAVQELRRA